MDDLCQKILDLSRAQAIEAALALGSDIFPNGPNGPTGPTGSSGPTEPTQHAQRLDIGLLLEVRANPFQNLAAIEALSRMFLLLAAYEDSCRSKLEDLLARTGTKADVFEDVELIAVSTLSLLGMRRFLTPSKSHG